VFVGKDHSIGERLGEIEEHDLVDRLPCAAEGEALLSPEIRRELDIFGRQTCLFLGFAERSFHTLLLRLYLPLRKVPIAVAVVQHKNLRALIGLPIHDDTGRNLPTCVGIRLGIIRHPTFLNHYCLG
jgi:hypothetical protein